MPKVSFRIEFPISDDLLLHTLGKFVVSNDTGTSETSRRKQKPADGEDPVSDNANMMFVVVRNLKSQKAAEGQPQNANSILHDHRLQRGNIVKLGRLKFQVKDFRSDKQPANCDLKRRGVIDRSASPVKQRFTQNTAPAMDCQSAACNANSHRADEEDSDNEFNAEEAVEIDCGVVDTSAGSDVQCKVCWSNE